MANEGDNMMICPSCYGNGFLRARYRSANVPGASFRASYLLPHVSDETRQYVLRDEQCPVCESQGEIEGEIT